MKEQAGDRAMHRISTSVGATGYLGPAISNARNQEDLRKDFWEVAGNAGDGTESAGGFYDWGTATNGHHTWVGSIGWTPNADFNQNVLPLPGGGSLSGSRVGTWGSSYYQDQFSW